MNAAADKAKTRFWLLQLVNFGAVALTFLAAAIIVGRFDPALPEWTGYAVLIGAGATFFFLPRKIRRRWARQDGRR